MNDLPLEGFLYQVLTTNSWLVRSIDNGTVNGGDGCPTALGDPRRSPLESFGAVARQQAGRMGKVYELLYCLENSVRELIERTLTEGFGADDWWTVGVPDTITKAADKRKVDDLKARWHGPRGDSLLNYVDFPQYCDVIVHQWPLFEDLLGDRDWVVNYFSEMNRTRRALAHTGSLTEEDVERMELRVREWLRVVG